MDDYGDLFCDVAASITGCGYSQLHVACYRGSVQQIKVLLTKPADINQTALMRNTAKAVVAGVTPLMLAAQQGHLAVCKLLVKNGAKPHISAWIPGTSRLLTPASVALANGHFATWLYLRLVSKGPGKIVDARYTVTTI